MAGSRSSLDASMISIAPVSAGISARSVRMAMISCGSARNSRTSAGAMIDDMTARRLGPQTQRHYIRGCKRFAAFLGCSRETASADDIRRFQLDLAGSGLTISHRNGIVAGVKFLFRVTLRRHDLAAEFYRVREPRRIPPVMSPDEIGHLLAAAQTLKLRLMLALAYGCGLRAGEVVLLRVGDIDSAQSERYRSR
jgi:integrase/recombinase XerD